jgi:hypothetical protein
MIMATPAGVAAAGATCQIVRSSSSAQRIALYSNGATVLTAAM